MINVKNITIFILILCLNCPVLAQEKPPQVRADLLAVGFGKPLTLYYRDGQGIAKLEIFSSGMGSPVYYKGEAVLNFYKNEEDLAPPAKGVEPPAPVAVAKLSAENRRTLLVFMASEEKVNVKAYGISDARMKAGDYYLFNFSKYPVAAAMGRGAKPIQVAPGSSFITNDKALRSKRMDLPITFYFNKGGKKFRRVYSSVWGHSPNQRTFLFMTDTGKENKPITFRRFRESPSVETAPR